MTLPTGTISMSQVNAELGRFPTSSIPLGNDADVKSIARQPPPPIAPSPTPGTLISMSMLRGKCFRLTATAGPPTTVITVPSYPDGGVNYRAHIFRGPGTFSVTCAGPGLLEYLVVGGGAGTATATVSGITNTGRCSGGGGAGACRTGINFPVTVGNYPVTVGGGGAAGPTGVNGGLSSFSSITSFGGGASSTDSPNASGGGGNASPAITTTNKADPGGIGAGSANLGFNGGSGFWQPIGPTAPNVRYSAGGGGGATTGGNPGAPLTPFTFSPGRARGGIAFSSALLASLPAPSRPSVGSAVAGGGGGGVSSSLQFTVRSSGGGGGGGFGANLAVRSNPPPSPSLPPPPVGIPPPPPGPVAGTPGTVNTGGGGGGGGGTPGYAGGSGLVVIRYRI